MKRNIKHYSDEASHTTSRQHRKTGNHEVNQEERLFDSETHVDGNGKHRKRYDRNEQKRLYLQRLH